MVLRPARHEMHDCSERGDVRLGGRDAGFDAGAQRNGVMRGARERRPFRVDERHHERTRVPGRGRGSEQVRACARLRDRDEQDAFEIRLRRIERADRRRGRGREQAGARLDQVSARYVAAWSELPRAQVTTARGANFRTTSPRRSTRSRFAPTASEPPRELPPLPGTCGCRDSPRRAEFRDEVVGVAAVVGLRELDRVAVLQEAEPLDQQARVARLRA